MLHLATSTTFQIDLATRETQEGGKLEKCHKDERGWEEKERMNRKHCAPSRRKWQKTFLRVNHKQHQQKYIKQAFFVAWTLSEDILYTILKSLLSCWSSVISCYQSQWPFGSVHASHFLPFLKTKICFPVLWFFLCRAGGNVTQEELWGRATLKCIKTP